MPNLSLSLKTFFENFHFYVANKMKIHVTETHLTPTFSASLPPSPSLPDSLPSSFIHDKDCNICKKNRKRIQ